MNDVIDRQFNRAYVSRQDMELCVQFCAALDSASDPVIQRALVTAAIISYARPFSGNADHAKATSSPKVRQMDLTEVERTLHKRICNLRNNALAHSDYDMNPTSAVQYRQAGYLVASRLYDPLAEMDNMGSLHSLAKKMWWVFDENLRRLSTRKAHESSLGSNESDS